MKIMKFPRTPHVPFSAQVIADKARDDNINHDYFSYIQGNSVVVTEKMDGGNTCLSRDGNVYARSHSGSASDESFDYLKALMYNNFLRNVSKSISLAQYLKKYDMDMFVENLYYIHSIDYSNLVYHNYYGFAIRVWSDKVFRIKDKDIKEANKPDKNTQYPVWLDWGRTVRIFQSFGMPIVNYQYLKKTDNEKDTQENCDLILRNFSYKNNIISTPDICHGKPRISGTRVTVSVIQDNIAEGHPIEGICKDFSLTEEQIQACTSKPLIDKTEGWVMRNTQWFPDDEFKNNVFKWVREDHVQTEAHWSKHKKKTQVKS